MLTARWPQPGARPSRRAKSLELFAAQAGASLRNAQVHQELAVLKDRLAHEASHDALHRARQPRAGSTSSSSASAARAGPAT